MLFPTSHLHSPITCPIPSISSQHPYPNTAQHRSPAFPSLPFPSAREGEKEGTSSVVALQARRRAQGDQAAALFSLSPYPASPSPLREFACWRAPWGDAGKCGERLDDVGAVTCNLTVNCNTLTVITLTCSWMILSNSVLCCPLLTSVSPHSLFPSKHARPVRRSATGRCSGGRWRLSGCSSRRMEMLMYLLFISCTRPSVQFQLY